MSFRLLICGLPNSAKTGAGAALANAGWTVRYLDFDGKPDSMLNYCKNAEARKRVQIVKCIDEFRILSEAAARGQKTLLKTDGAPTGYETALRSLEKWPVDKSDPSKWKPEKDVLWVDTLTYMARAILARLKNVSGTEDKKVSWTDYEMVQTEIDRFLTLCKIRIPCPVVCCTHLQLVGPDLNVEAEDEELRDDLLREKLRGAEKMPWGMKPITLGKAQAVRLIGHFTGSLYVKAVEGRGRRIITQPEDGFEAGVPVPGLAKELDLADGLEKIFSAMLKAGK